MPAEENAQLSPEEERALSLLGQYGPSDQLPDDISAQTLEALAQRGLVTATQGRYALTMAGRQVSRGLVGTNDSAPSL